MKTEEIRQESAEEIRQESTGEIRQESAEEGFLDEGLLDEGLLDEGRKRDGERTLSACLRRCGLLLGSRDYSVLRLKQKLLQAGFPEAVVDEAQKKLQEAGYLDDGRYARSFIRSHLSDRSRLRIIKDLSDRGIAEDVIEEAFGDFGEEEFEDAQLRQIRRLLEKRRYGFSEASFEETQKTKAFLHRKGFHPALIRRAMQG